MKRTEHGEVRHEEKERPTGEAASDKFDSSEIYMERINTGSTASINFAEVRISDDELAVYETALKLALEKLSDHEVEQRFGATRDELEGICEDVSATLAVCKKAEWVAA